MLVHRELQLIKVGFSPSQGFITRSHNFQCQISKLFCREGFERLCRTKILHKYRPQWKTQCALEDGLSVVLLSEIKNLWAQVYTFFNIRSNLRFPPITWLWRAKLFFAKILVHREPQLQRVGISPSQGFVTLDHNFSKKSWGYLRNPSAQRTSTTSMSCYIFSLTMDSGMMFKKFWVYILVFQLNIWVLSRLKT